MFFISVKISGGHLMLLLMVKLEREDDLLPKDLGSVGF
jgi:hypothetical protein